jgi:hypothetical protein
VNWHVLHHILDQHIKLPMNCLAHEADVGNNNEMYVVTTRYSAMDLWGCQKSGGACQLGLKVNVILLDKTSSFKHCNAPI